MLNDSFAVCYIADDPPTPPTIAPKPAKKKDTHN